MTQPAPAAWPAEDARLLEPSISYALGAVVAITPEQLSRRTPCRDWDLRMLLRHASESLAAIAEGIETGRVDLDPAAEDGDLAADPARAFRDRAGRHPLFAAPLTVPATAGPSDQLAAFLGRAPRE
jgi:hypothetical protein